MTNAGCQSCSMPIDNGELCQYCSTEKGELIPFAECLQRFMQWTLKNEPGLSPDDAKTKTLAFMAGMPAWKDHPEVRA